MRNCVHIICTILIALAVGMAPVASAAAVSAPKDNKVEVSNKSADNDDNLPKTVKGEKSEKSEKSEKPAAEEKHESVPVKVDVAPMVYDGIDVSRHQKDIDWEEVARDKNVKYVYVKATEGATFVDPRYRANIEGAHRAGIKVGAYHFLRTGTRIQDQFDNFTTNVSKGEMDLIPLLDVEVKQGWSNQQLRDSVMVFLQMLEEHYGCKPMIYTSSSFFNTILGRAFAEYPLFIARYAANEPRLDNGAQWIMWQFSEKGRVRGIDHAVDMSRFNKGRSLRDILIRDNKLQHHKRRTSDVVDKNHEKPATINVKKEAPTMSAQQEKELKKKQEKEQKARERAEKLAREDQKKKAEQDAKKRAEQVRKPVSVQSSGSSTEKPSAKPVRRRTTTDAASTNTPTDEDMREAQARAEKEAKEQAEREAREQAAREKQLAKERAKAEKEARKKAEREKAAQEKAEREAQKKVDQLVKEEIKRQEAEEAAAKKAQEEAQAKKAEEAKEAERAAKKAEEEAKMKAQEEAKQKAIAEKRAQAQAKAQAELEEEAKREEAKKVQQQKKQDTKAKLQQQKAASTSTSTSTTTPTKKRINKSSADND